MSESYSDRWKREFLEKHPEIAAEHQGTRVPPHRTHCLPATSWTAPQTSRAVTPRQMPNTQSQRSHEHLAAQATPSDGTAMQSTQALVRAACELRYQLRLTQCAFAERLGLNPRTWQEWEQGRRMPSGPGRVLLMQMLDKAAEN